MKTNETRVNIEEAAFEINERAMTINDMKGESSVFFRSDSVTFLLTKTAIVVHSWRPEISIASETTTIIYILCVFWILPSVERCVSLCVQIVPFAFRS